ncbi:MAG: hypothetical protein Q9M50_11285 [Methylococcales bacterium]|nr:hypothetical protein [Methylococcales bacterium]
MSQTALSGDERIDALLSTLSWSEINGQGVNLTYSFPTENSTWVDNYSGDEPFEPNDIYFLTPRRARMGQGGFAAMGKCGQY